jgi:hypothetical protein
MDSFDKYISICIWGEWLGGRPGENAYLLIGREYDKKDDKLILNFNGNEKCTIINPIKMEWKGKCLLVKSAQKIIWEFYYYGKPQTPETRTLIEYTFIDKNQVHVIEKGNYWNRDEVINILGKKAIESF